MESWKSTQNSWDSVLPFIIMLKFSAGPQNVGILWRVRTWDLSNHTEIVPPKIDANARLLLTFFCNGMLVTPSGYIWLYTSWGLLVFFFSLVKTAPWRNHGKTTWDSCIFSTYIISVFFRITNLNVPEKWEWRKEKKLMVLTLSHI